MVEGREADAEAARGHYHRAQALAGLNPLAGLKPGTVSGPHSRVLQEGFIQRATDLVRAEETRVSAQGQALQPAAGFRRAEGR